MDLNRKIKNNVESYLAKIVFFLAQEFRMDRGFTDDVSHQYRLPDSLKTENIMQEEMLRGTEE